MIRISAGSNAQAGKPEEALRSFQQAVDLLESLSIRDPQNSYDLACNLAQSIPLIGMKNGSSGLLGELSTGDQLRRQLYGNCAIEALREATGAGFVTAETIQDNTELNSLRVAPTSRRF